MIKHFCDICGKEVKDTNSIKLYTWVNKEHSDLERRYFDVCGKCKALLEIRKQIFEADSLDDLKSYKTDEKE